MGDTLDKLTQSLQDRFLDRGKLYVAERKFTFSNTSLKDCLVIRNPSGSGTEVIIFSIETSIDLTAVATQLNQVLLQIKINPVFSSVGTAVNTRNLSIGKSNTTKTEAYHDPTVTDNGNILQRAIGINKASNIPSPIRLQPDKDLLVRLAVNDATNSILVNVIFGEE